MLTKRDRIQTLLNENYQTVLNCYVVGSNCIDRSFVTNVEVNNKERYLVVTEFDERTVSDDLFQNSKRMDN